MINPYTYIQQNDSYDINLTEETTLWHRYRIAFPSSQPTKYLGSSQVVGDYIYPKGVRRAPLAILIHGMGERSVIPCRMMARTLAKNGIASFILYLVFHRYRGVDSLRLKYPSLTAEEWFESYQLSVTDVRQVIDWASSRKEIVEDKIAVAGISFGGFISAIAMALDKRIKAGILIVTAGNSDKITRRSLLLRHQYKMVESEYQRNQECYAQYLTEVNEKGFEHVIPGKSSYLTDPMTFSSCLRNRPVLMLNALWDEMMPRVAALDLWRAYGKPEIAWYPATHASIWVWYPLMGGRIKRFLNSVFGPNQYRQ